MSADGAFVDSTRVPVTRVSTSKQHEAVLGHLTAALKILGYEVFIGPEKTVILPQHELRIQRVQSVVAEACGIKVGDLLSVRRTATLTKPRHLAIWLCVECTGGSSMQIGRAFGRDHSTVLYAHKNFIRFVRADETFGALAQALRVKLNDEFSEK